MSSVGSAPKYGVDTSNTCESVLFVLRRNRSEVLVVRRCPELGGYWHAIAGGVEPGESFEQAALRELREETGLLVGDTAIRRLPYVDSEYDLGEPCDDSHSGADVSVRVRSFLLEVDDEFEPIIDWEHDAYRWCDVAEAVSLLCWRNIRHSLVLLLAH
jgi:8-oxo-dGTP pyrophosphatase MutT (NUDIX family)